MIIEGFVWFTQVVDTIEAKHGVSVAEVEETIQVMKSGWLTTASRCAQFGRGV
ncbi:MAG: hypothetical protein ABII06_09150 [Pseudomonadota bacterium]